MAKLTIRMPDPESEKRRLDSEVEKYKAFIKEHEFSQEDLINFAANLLVQNSEMEELYGQAWKEVELLANERGIAISAAIEAAKVGKFKIGSGLLEMLAGNNNNIARAMTVLIQSQKTEYAKNAARAKHDRDPKQAAKQYVFTCWQVWQEEPERYKYKSEFAKAMLACDQCKSLKSQKKIEDWCREWGKSVPS